MFDTTAEIEEALDQGQLEETHVFDGKRLPGQNRDIAIDVCAMTVDGGTLIYGVDEDDNNHITISAPIELAGQRERIDQIVQASIMEPPTIYVSERPTEADPARGYLVVGVPQSPRAPHQVIVGRDMRYYGRGATGNRILTENEIAGLYERRERWAVDRDAHLEEIVQGEPFTRAGNWAYLLAFARPFGFDTGFLRRRIQEDEMAMRNALVAAAQRNSIPEHVNYMPDLREKRGWELDGSRGIRIGSNEHDLRQVMRATIGRDGEARLFCCCGTRVRDDGPISVFDHLLGGNLAGLFSVAGDFYHQAGYIGAVDVGGAVTGIQGSHSHFLVHQRGIEERITVAEGLAQREHRRTDRVLASDLQERPDEVAEGLLRDLFDALAGMNFTPFG